MNWKEIEYKQIWPDWNIEISNIEDLQMLSKNIFINLKDEEKIKDLLEKFIDTQENKDIKKILAILFIKVYFLIKKDSKSPLEIEFIEIIEILNDTQVLNKENYKNNELYLNFINKVINYLQNLKLASEDISISKDKVVKSTAWIIQAPKSNSLDKKQEKEKPKDINEFDIKVLEFFVDRVKSNIDIDVSREELEDKLNQEISLNTIKNFKEKLFDLFIKQIIEKKALRWNTLTKDQVTNEMELIEEIKRIISPYFKKESDTNYMYKVEIRDMEESEIKVKNSWIDIYVQVITNNID